ncbi:hypothetical protein ACEWX3_07605 [Mycobacterium sp. G7A2]|uniref:hypothetical protein n=1 Tax=Mycobacterium sp. G7A2 TaxID=3317307 RepID=UPI0035A90632
MASSDPAKIVKDALVTAWTAAHPSWTATLRVDDDYLPTQGSPTLLVADDGGPAVHSGPWMVGKTLRRITIRLTAFAKGRDEARTVVDAATDHITTYRPPGIARIEDVSAPLVTRDRATGAYLASITVQVIVRPVTA